MKRFYLLLQLIISIAVVVLFLGLLVLTAKVDDDLAFIVNLFILYLTVSYGARTLTKILYGNERVRRVIAGEDRPNA